MTIRHFKLLWVFAAAVLASGGIVSLLSSSANDRPPQRVVSESSFGDTLPGPPCGPRTSPFFPTVPEAPDKPIIVHGTVVRLIGFPPTSTPPASNRALSAVVDVDEIIKGTVTSKSIAVSLTPCLQVHIGDSGFLAGLITIRNNGTTDDGTLPNLWVR
jgi:hypothetical protein